MKPYDKIILKTGINKAGLPGTMRIRVCLPEESKRVFQVHSALLPYRAISFFLLQKWQFVRCRGQSIKMILAIPVFGYDIRNRDIFISRDFHHWYAEVKQYIMNNAFHKVKRYTKKDGKGATETGDSVNNFSAVFFRFSIQKTLSTRQIRVFLPGQKLIQRESSEIEPAVNRQSMFHTGMKAKRENIKSAGQSFPGISSPAPLHTHIVRLLTIYNKERTNHDSENIRAVSFLVYGNKSKTTSSSSAELRHKLSASIFGRTPLSGKFHLTERKWIFLSAKSITRLPVSDKTSYLTVSNQERVFKGNPAQRSGFTYSYSTFRSNPLLNPEGEFPVPHLKSSYSSNEEKSKNIFLQRVLLQSGLSDMHHRFFSLSSNPNRPSFVQLNADSIISILHSPVQQTNKPVSMICNPQKILHNSNQLFGYGAASVSILHAQRKLSIAQQTEPGRKGDDALMSAKRLDLHHVQFPSGSAAGAGEEKNTTASNTSSVTSIASPTAKSTAVRRPRGIADAPVEIASISHVGELAEKVMRIIEEKYRTEAKRKGLL